MSDKTIKYVYDNFIIIKINWKALFKLCTLLLFGVWSLSNLKFSFNLDFQIICLKIFISNWKKRFKLLGCISKRWPSYLYWSSIITSLVSLNLRFHLIVILLAFLLDLWVSPILLMNSWHSIGEITVIFLKHNYVIHQ